MKHCTVLPIKDQRLCMSEVSKVVFVAFTQQYIKSNLTHVGSVKSAYRTFLTFNRFSIRKKFWKAET